MYHKPRPTFTLTDLFVSLSAVTVLAALFLPVLSDAQRNNNLTICLSSMSKLGRGLLLYTQDYDGRMPSAFVNIPPVNGGNTGIIPYDMQILPYMQTKVKTFACPSDTTSLNFDTSAMWDGMLISLRLRRSYVYVSAVNTQARADAGQSQPDPNTGMSTWGAGNALADMDSPTETIALTEGWATNADGSGTSSLVGSTWGSLFTNCDTWKLPGRNKPAQSPVDNPPPGCANDYTDPNKLPSLGHNHLGNSVLADGHVKTYSWQQVRANDFSLFKLRK